MQRLLHIGLGNFHRAHQAWYTARAEGDWRITGVVMRNEALFDTLKNGTGYSLGIRGANGLQVEHITVHDRVLLASRDAAAVVDAFVDPELHVVTLTITEKGYCLAPATGRLDLTHPDIAADLAGRPSGAIGLLAHGLARRMDAGLNPLTVLSCDNLSGNGSKLAAAVEDFAKSANIAFDPGNRFPDTMVDRITPATTEGLIDEITASAGRPAVAPVMTEAFTEWVIEDDFAGPRPDWENVGAELVPDVAPFEKRKLRLLNAAHSWLAYAGLLAGHRYVHEAMADPALRRGVERLWDMAAATLPPVVIDTLPAYRDALIDRFAVAEMRHELIQIAADGSLKMRERIVPLMGNTAEGSQALDAVAAWIAFALRAHRDGTVFADPNAKQIARLFDDARDIRDAAAQMADLIGVPDASPVLLDTLATRVTSYAV
ncbi:fructuronate reductase [Monaibacterium marinum]|uniref:Fructuronate reductase n=1 Tax=Pontivivens marinum TaxID=1690039 RepID=A0A2C9CWP2_9RHOB|nr:mannitol dehydrogenase family protein [Monaibacterium marinum]SOH95535.1 fructuronate reductase [Monaibacterium marinum]